MNTRAYADECTPSESDRSAMLISHYSHRSIETNIEASQKSEGLKSHLTDYPRTRQIKLYIGNSNLSSLTHPLPIMLELLLAQYYSVPVTTTTTTVIAPATAVYSTYPTAPTVYPSPTYRSNYPSYPSFYRTYPQTTVIIQTTPIYYPPAIQSRCNTSIVGSPIPSPVPLDRLTGQPCR